MKKKLRTVSPDLSFLGHHFGPLFGLVGQGRWVKIDIVKT